MAAAWNRAAKFRLALSNSFPTGTGSFGYKGAFQIVVQNLAFVSSSRCRITLSSGVRPPITAKTSSWRSTPLTARLSGTTTRAPTISSRRPSMTLWCSPASTTKSCSGTASIAAGTLHITAGVQNLAFAKAVGGVFTTDN
jgi:hypothetical protein